MTLPLEKVVDGQHSYSTYIHVHSASVLVLGNTINTQVY